MYIFLKDEELLDVAQNINQTRFSLIDEINRIQRLFQELEGDWQSEAQRALAAKIVCISSCYSKQIDMCDNLSRIIIDYVNTILDIDSTESISINNIDGGN